MDCSHRDYVRLAMDFNPLFPPVRFCAPFSTLEKRASPRPVGVLMFGTPLPNPCIDHSPVNDTWVTIRPPPLRKIHGNSTTNLLQKSQSTPD